MYTDWRSLYEAALREQDPAKIHEACEQARRAIYNRLLLLTVPDSPLPTKKSPQMSEREELEEATRQLFIREHNL